MTVANEAWIVDWLGCVGDPGETWIEQFPKGSNTEFDVRFVIERSDDKSGKHRVNIAIRQEEKPPLTPVLTYNILRGIYNAALCTDIYGVSTPTILRNSDPTYDTFRTMLMDCPYRCILPLVNLREPDDSGLVSLDERPIQGSRQNYGIVSGLLQALGDFDLALFLSLELMYARHLLNAVPPGSKPFDIRYWSVGTFEIQACCMSIERTLKDVITLIDPSYNHRIHSRHNSEVWRFIVENYPEVAETVVNSYNDLPKPWDELPPGGDPASVNDIGRILAVLDADLYERARYPNEMRGNLPRGEDGSFLQPQPHHDSALPVLRVAVAAMAVIASWLGQHRSK